MIIIEGFKETLEDHRIGDVKDLELIDVEEIDSVAELVSHSQDSVLLCSLHLVHSMFSNMNLLHEFIVVHSKLVLDWDFIEEGVHEESLP